MAEVAGLEAQQQGRTIQMDSVEGLVVDMGIDKARSRYPFCIVWTPLPIITWFLPPIGGYKYCCTVAGRTCFCACSVRQFLYAWGCVFCVSFFPSPSPACS